MNKKFSELLIQSYGINISKYDETHLNNLIQKRMIETNSNSKENYFEFLKQSEIENRLLIDSLQISYTEFFRNSLTFATLEKIVFPMIIHKMKNSNRKEIRIWSAACATGQEAYSLAILLEELKINSSIKFDYRIFATDQNESCIHEAMKGQYPKNSLNNLNLKYFKWFTKQDEIYIVKSELKKNIDFSIFDLFNEQLCCPPASIFGDFDLIISANLLFYYKPEFRKLILDKVSHCLITSGYLITGEAEREVIMNYNFNEVFTQSAIFQRIVTK